MTPPEALSAEDVVERLRLVAAWHDEESRDVMSQAASLLSRLLTERRECAEALEPFKKAADVKLCGEWRDDQRFAQTDVGFYLNFGDLRRAASAFDKVKEKM